MSKAVQYSGSKRRPTPRAARLGRLRVLRMHARPPRGRPEFSSNQTCQSALDSFEASHRCVVVGACHMPADRCVNTCRLHVHAPESL
jgi:hypothetical protein